MADMDEEFARFLGEVKSVEEAVAAADPQQSGSLPSSAQVRAGESLVISLRSMCSW
jgi:hypothetical protein